MNTHYEIRLAQDADFEQIYTIWLQGIAHTFANAPMPENLKDLFKENFDARCQYFNYWVATIANNKVIGWASLCRVSNHPIKKNWMAEFSIYFDVSFRSCSGTLSRALINHVEKHTIESPIKYIYAYTTTDNKPILKLVKEFNWLQIGELPENSNSEKDLRKIIIMKPIN